MSERASGPARVLRGEGLRPRKRLGQNFLRDESFLQRIVDAAGLEPHDEVLEIGSGTGVLTRAAAGRSQRVVAVELDDSLFHLLSRDFADVIAVEVLHANALDVDPCALFGGPYKLLGNIPYYITGPLIRHFLEAECTPQVMVLMVQREVGDRITAEPGRMSMLSLSVQFYAEARVVTRVPAGAFYPKPKVDSAIIQITPYSGTPGPERDVVFALARAGFSMKRKQIANSLAAGAGLPRVEVELLLKKAHIDPMRRAQTLSVAEWRTLAFEWMADLTEGAQ